MAAIATGAGLQRAIAAPDAPSGVDALIDAHRAARAALTAATEMYDKAFEKVPDASVQLFSSMAASVVWSAEEIDKWAAAAVKHLKVSPDDAVTWRCVMEDDLDQAKARRLAVAATVDLDRLEKAVEVASDAEWAAFQALRDYRPADMGEVAAKARYLISTIEVDNEGERMADSAVELLRSLVA
ncbi:hypothetical protein EFV37_13105 [Mesorhizobium loti]|uniref:Uncharacterized protein n=1 Tax=Mesorhizobium jarvisii TaxID=1777867 RepID=A0A6M7TFN0_9HYPH|nr:MULTISPECIES: hypothetical protein [Mesorhizobium]OBQ58024.1 hypothetical protein A9K72_27850 [Mesorhizobium loti]QKC63136.1 hypothetical protein EB229_13095 [Mesorhizobium jarvisii]QKD09047.1 hypothetical protein EFV37_13105 [Mesorhizobium loti]RJT30143.1 hypothetical protein D3242_25830 [Mesorhizobium jarvisii]